MGDNTPTAEHRNFECFSAPVSLGPVPVHPLLYTMPDVLFGKQKYSSRAPALFMPSSPSLSQCLEQSRNQNFLTLRNSFLESRGSYSPKIALSPFVYSIVPSPRQPCQADTITASCPMKKLWCPVFHTTLSASHMPAMFRSMLPQPQTHQIHLGLHFCSPCPHPHSISCCHNNAT